VRGITNGLGVFAERQACKEMWGSALPTCAAQAGQPRQPAHPPARGGRSPAAAPGPAATAAPQTPRCESPHAPASAPAAAREG
jgi:hypothetical protein